MRILSHIILAAILPSSGVQEIPPHVLTNDVVSVSEASKRRLRSVEQRLFFRLEGRISAALAQTFVLRDNSGAVCVMVSCDEKWTPGDMVRIVATHLRKAPFDPLFIVEALNIEVLAHGTPDAIRPISPTRLSDDDCDFRPVRVAGVVTDAFRDEVSPEWNILIIESDGASAAAYFMDRQATQGGLNKMIDAVVSVEGVFFPAASGSRRFLGAWIQVFSKNSVRIVEPPVADPFAVEEMSDDRILSGTRNPQRRKASGTVVATWGERSLFLRMSDTNSMEVQLERGSPSPPVGSLVTVSGFVRRNTFYARLCNALLRVDSVDGGNAGQPISTSARSILFDEHGERKVISRLNGQLIRIAGSVRDILVSWKDERRIILNCDGITVPVLLGAGIAPPEIGSIVRVVGACRIAVEGEAGEFARLGGFSVITRSKNDIVVTKNPPWWTPGRLMAVIGALLAVLAGILVWNASLRIGAARRARQLVRAQAEKLKADIKVEERTRLAVELHDSLSQTLTGISLLVDSVASVNSGGDTMTTRLLGTIRQMLTSCRRELQGCLWDLRSRTFEEKDMSEAVSRTITPNVGDAKVSCRFNVPRKILSESATHCVLRIIRELVVNAVRHGKATKVMIAGEHQDGALRFSVKDNGIGFDVNAAPGPSLGHFGIQGIKERINDFNGRMEITSAPRAGTKVTVSMKIAAEEGTKDGQ